MSPLHSIRSFFKGKKLSDYPHLLSVPAAAGIGILVLIDVGGREFFGKGMFGAYTVESLLLMVLCFCSVAASWRDGEFIRMETLYRRLPERARMIADVLAILLGLSCCIALLWLSSESVITTFSDGTRAGPTSMPLWPWKLGIPIGVLFLCYEMITRLVRNIRQYKQKKAVS
jgi:TRAP-type C4-dicarboxylate transport system permease small subunit